MAEANTKRATVLRAVLGVAAAALLAAGVTAGDLLLGVDTGGARAAEADRYATPPDCDALDGDALESVAPGAGLDVAQDGPMDGGAVRSCEWTAVDDPAAPPRSVQVEFRVYYSGDDAGGAEAAERYHADWLAHDPDAATAAGGARPAGPGAAEAMIVRDNLVARVWVAGVGDGAAPQPADEAVQQAADLVESLEARL